MIAPNHVQCNCGRAYANWSALFAHARIAHGVTVRLVTPQPAAPRLVRVAAITDAWDARLHERRVRRAARRGTA